MILRISSVTPINLNHVYECDIPNDFGDYYNDLKIEIWEEQIIRKSSLEEIKLLKTTKKYNL